MNPVPLWKSRSEFYEKIGKIKAKAIFNKSSHYAINSNSQRITIMWCAFDDEEFSLESVTKFYDSLFFPHSAFPVYQIEFKYSLIEN